MKAPLSKPTASFNAGFLKTSTTNSTQKQQQTDNNELLSQSDNAVLKVEVEKAFESDNKATAMQTLKEKLMSSEPFAKFVANIKNKFNIASTGTVGMINKVSAEDFQTFFPTLLEYIKNPVQKLMNFSANVNGGLKLSPQQIAPTRTQPQLQR